MLRSVSGAALLLPFLAVPALAQVPAHLVGLTRANSALRTTGADCVPVNIGCQTGLPATVEPWAGGTAYDSQSGQVWVSNGAVVARVNARSCAVTCGPWQAPVGNGVVTGLEVLETQNQLLVLDSTGVLNTLSLGGSCGGPQLISSCSTGLPRVGQRATSGLAADEALGLVFYTYTDFASGDNTLLVATFANPCLPIFRGPLPDCGLQAFGAARGLAVESCRHVLYVTDGFRVMSLRYLYNPTVPAIQFAPPQCCPNLSTVGDPYVGLALRPSPGVPVGPSCTNGSCRNCPTTHTLLTGATVGNPNLLFALEQAQDNTLTWLALGAGHCRPGPIYPPLCGPVLVNTMAPPAIAGPFPVSGAGPCGASAVIVVSVPADPSFCGSDWSSQFLSLCPGISSVFPLGTAMSNCLNFTIIGS